MTETMIYWITRLNRIHNFCDGIQTIALLFAVIGFIILLVAAILKHMAEADGTDSEVKMSSGVCKMSCKIWIPALCVAMICSFARIFTPTTQELVAIKVIPQIASTNNVEKIKGISKDLFDITANWLKDLQNNYIKNKAQSK